MLKKIVAMASVAFASLCVGVTSVLANPAAIEVTVPANNIQFDGIVAAITAQLFPIMAAAGGLGLAIWIVMMLFRKFKQMGRFCLPGGATQPPNSPIKRSIKSKSGGFFGKRFCGYVTR